MTPRDQSLPPLPAPTPPSEPAPATPPAPTSVEPSPPAQSPPAAPAPAPEKKELPPPAEPHTITGILGLGVTAASDGTGAAAGLFAAAEYATWPTPWLSPRAYAGVLWTAAGTNGCSAQGPCDVFAHAVLVGIKGRLFLPIPYVAPFIDLGVGLSFGLFQTLTASVDQEYGGVTYHLPVAFGLALGRDHEVELSIESLYHPALSQSVGAINLALAFPAP